MFVLDGGLARINGAKLTNVRLDSDDDDVKKESPEKPSESVLFGKVEVGKTNDAIKKGEIPGRLLLTTEVLKKLNSLGLSDEHKSEIARIISENIDDSIASKAPRYLALASDRYELLVNFGSKTSDDFHTLFVKSFGEEYSKWLETLLQNDKESREIEKVMVILCFLTSNPLGVISSLKNLLSSLETAGALQMAGGGIHDAGSVAASNIASKAKDNPDAAKYEANQFSSLASSIPEHLDAGHGVESQSLDEGSLIIDQGNFQYEGASISIRDKETGEIIPLIEEENDFYDSDESIEEVHAAAHEAVGNALTITESAKKSQHEVNRIADEKKKEDGESQIRELTSEQRNLNGKNINYTV